MAAAKDDYTWLWVIGALVGLYLYSRSPQTTAGSPLAAGGTTAAAGPAHLTSVPAYPPGLDTIDNGDFIPGGNARNPGGLYEQPANIIPPGTGEPDRINPDVSLPYPWRQPGPPAPDDEPQPIPSSPFGPGRPTLYGPPIKAPPYPDPDNY